MYIMKIIFSEDLLESYETIIDWLYAKSFEQFYNKGNEVSVVWPVIKDAFKDSMFESLKISRHSFWCYVDLWRGINVNPPPTIHFQFCHWHNLSQSSHIGVR